MWDKLNDQYEGLLNYIALKISGNKACSPEDYVQELWIVLLGSVKSYIKKLEKDTGIKYTFDEIWDDKDLHKGFDQWCKTCLWNAKNTIGKQISLRHKFYNSLLSEGKFIDKEDWSNWSQTTHTSLEYIKDSKSFNDYSRVILEDSLPILPDLEAKIVKCIVDGDVLMENG